MTDKPTQEQIKEFWEWCELEWKWNHNPQCPCGAVDDEDSRRSWHTKDGSLATRFWHEDLAVDPTNLFKYAVPKLDKGEADIQFIKFSDTGWFVRLENQVITVEADTPALALFWALWQVKEKK